MCCWSALPGVGAAQIERYELGKRLRRFEEAWQQAPPDVRTQAAPIMQEAVKSFFTLNRKQAAAKLDQAWFVARNTPIADWERGAIACRIKIPSCLVDSGARSLTVSLADLYRDAKTVPAGLQTEWAILDGQGKALLTRVTSWEDARHGIGLPLDGLPAGDFRVHVSVHQGEKSLSLPSMTFSRLQNLDSRLLQLDEAHQSETPVLNESVRATLRDHVALIRRIKDGGSVEADYPLHQILALDERLMREPSDVPELVSTAAGEHDLWMVLADGRRRVPIRLRSPQAISGASNGGRLLPVLFLFHGAGGSENMFFETYGAGRAVAAGIERGWLVVAPRQGLMGVGLDCAALLQALDAFFPIDHQQVYMLGHSMGAAQVIRQVRLHPELPRAAAVIGGGAAPRDVDRLVDVPWYVAAGELDFGRRGATAFFQSLQQAGASRAVYEEFPRVEHMVIVQASLPATFAFFDRVAARTAQE